VFGATVTGGKSEPEGFRLESGTSDIIKRCKVKVNQIR
jgi:hypothetical protein